MTSLHATCIAIDGHGVLILGASGSGKSDLALRMIDQQGCGIGDRSMSARLVADDQVVIERTGNRVIASPPHALAGLLEVRGLGIVKMEHAAQVPVALVVELTPLAQIERLPEPDELGVEIEGVPLARVQIDPASPSAPARVRRALIALSDDQVPELRAASLREV